MYYAEFDEQGNRLASHVADGFPYTDKDIKALFPLAIPISDEDQELYATNKYIRGVDGSPQLKPPHISTTAELQKQFTDAVQNHLDSTVQTRGYDNIVSCCSYATSTDPIFAAEAQAAVVWRDNVWRYCYTQMDLILNGQRELPTIPVFIAELEPIVWPE